MKRIGIGVVLAGAILWIGFAIVSLFAPHNDEAQSIAEPYDMQLIGVRPDYSDDLLTPRGRFLCKNPPVNIPNTHWSRDKLQRDFVFEIPIADDSFKLAGHVHIYLNGNRGYALRPRVFTIRSADKTRVVVNALLPRLSMRSKSVVARLRGGDPVDTVDIHMSYLAGPPKTCDAVFTGPFSNGDIKDDDHNQGYNLQIQCIPISLGYVQLKLKVVCANVLDTRAPLVLYLNDGTRKFLRPLRSETTSGGSVLQYAVGHLGPQELSRVTCNEIPYKKTFRDIVVRYRRRDPYTHAVFVDELGRRLQFDPDDKEHMSRFIYQSTLEDPNEALRLLDIVRGRALITVSRTIREKLAVDKLSESEQQRIRTILHGWLGTECEPHALALGLWGNWPEFVEPSLGYLKWTRIKRLSERALISSFQYQSHPTDEVMYKVAEYLITCKTKYHPPCQDLLRFLQMQADSVAGREALIRLAACDRSWVWTSVIQPDEVFGKLMQQEGLPEVIRARAAALDVITDTDSVQVYKGIALWITPELMQKEPGQFRRVIAALARHGDPKTDTRVLADFLEQLLKVWHMYKTIRDVEMQNHLGVEKVVTLINRWHHLDLGGLGCDPNQESPPDLHHWRDIAHSASYWARSGRHPMQLPAGWQYGPQDLRIIWRNDDDVEKSVIGLWIYPRNVNDPVLHHVMRYAADICDYAIISNSQRDDADHLLEIRNHKERYYSDVIRVTLNPREVPLQLDTESPDPNRDTTPLCYPWTGHWSLFIEPARDRDSVLSGTDLFDAWKRRYLDDIPLDQPRPKVFSLYKQGSL